MVQPSLFTFEMSAYVFVSKMEGPGGFVVDNILVSMVRKVYGHILHNIEQTIRQGLYNADI